MFSDEGLGNFYKTNFDLMSEHQGFTLDIVENMIPWEREIYISLLLAKLKKQKEEIENGRR